MANTRSTTKTVTSEGDKTATPESQYHAPPTGNGQSILPAAPGASRQDIARLSAEFEPMNLENNGVAPGLEVETLGADVKDVMAAMADLERLELTQLNISVPKCVVLGEQSTGKSSVIEAISGIKTPRSEGTCTRCPLFIRMTSSGEKWCARVYLQKSFTFDGRRRGRKFPGWDELDKAIEISFGNADSPEKLAELIQHAQIAVLNPGQDASTFLPGCVSPNYSARQAEFSPNLVGIEISYSGLPDLSFYDLPGIIGQSEDESTEYLVQFVHDLVSNYIKDDQALILVTCSLSNDIHNSTAAGMARKHKATDRCVGVLTKPDTLAPGLRRESMIRAVFDGKSFSLGHGYFVVKNLAQDEIDAGVSHHEARVREGQFFRDTQPWSQLLSEYEDRFGTSKLQAYLSKKLASQMLTAVPSISSAIDKRIYETEEKLSKIPESPTHNAINIATKLILDFSTNVQKEMEGEFPHNKWRNAWASIQKDFSERLLALKPRLQISGDLDVNLEALTKSAAAGKTIDDSILIGSDDEDEDDKGLIMDSPSKKRKLAPTPQNMTPRSTPSNTPLHARGTTVTPSHARAGTVQPEPSRIPQKDPNCIVYQLDSLALQLHQRSKTKLPGQVEPKVENYLIIENLRYWRGPLNTFFQELQDNLGHQIQCLFARHFGPWHGAGIYKTTATILADVLNAHFAEQRVTMAKEALDDELDGPYIFHKDELEKQKSIILEAYRQARYKKRRANIFSEMEASRGRVMNEDSRESLLRKEPQIQNVLLGEPYSVELDLVAKISAYYGIASRRFHDSVCMRVESKLFKFLRMQLKDELQSRLKIFEVNGRDICIELLAESPDRFHQRRKLEDEKQRLLDGQKTLNELQQKFVGQNDRGINGLTAFSPSPLFVPTGEQMEVDLYEN
ncbi:hypothetical protein BS50DRAFT_34096 [Corynespora cassiicola Philippines]|uniref:P-loop containing nucleoside triphosphate hydrolase protein n=1 Tax=Corynespora cassiicola Philippines TaxID=1448308 RepID=A0A2T2PC17_CORCC|nr:hypothetical protein BS50DRAFT_34096 [Corynespora cassiicola Philippines]